MPHSSESDEWWDEYDPDIDLEDKENHDQTILRTNNSGGRV